MKLIRILFSLILLIAVVLGLAIGSLYYFIDPNKLKPILAEELKNRTGYEAKIDGDFAWSLYPRVGVKVAHIALFSPKQSTPFIDLRGITFVTELEALLQGKQKLRGDIYIAEVTLLNVRAQNAHVELHWQNGILSLVPVTASLYSGTLNGAAHGRNLALVPTWDWDMQFADVELQPLLHDMDASNKINIAGVGQMRFRGATHGKTRDDMLSHLDGTLAITARNGVVQGIDINYLIETANAFVTRKPVSPPDNIDQTKFESLSGSMIIRKGILETDNLTLSSSAFGARASGSINLVYNAINMQLIVTPRNNPDVNWVVPIMLTGNIDRPDVRLDTSELTKMLAQKEIEKIKTKVRDEAKEHIHGKAGEYIQNLLGD